jgi:hypothetical protein
VEFELLEPEPDVLAVLDVTTVLVVVTVLLVVTTPPSESVDVPTTTVVPTEVDVPVTTPVELLLLLVEPFDCDDGELPVVLPPQAVRKARLTPAARAPPPPATAERRTRMRLRGCCVSGLVMPCVWGRG